MTLLVAGVVLGLGVPNFMEFIRNGAMTAAANELLTGSLLARSEALKAQDSKPVVLCLSEDPEVAEPTCEPDAVMDGTRRGFIVWVDADSDLDYDAGETLLLRSPAPGGTVRLSTNCSYLAYGANGFSRKLAGHCDPLPALRNFLYCDDRGRRITSGTLSAARVIRFDMPGRGQVLTDVADIGARIGADATKQVDATCP